MTESTNKKTRVAIVGAGCSGMSAAYSMSLSPEKFDVTIFEKMPVVGGSATSHYLPNKDYYGADYINDGVQGASPVFHNTFKMFEQVLGFKASEVQMQISFGKGNHEFWSNVFPSELVDRFQNDIKKFGKALQTIKRLEVFFAMIPVSRMLKLFNFSNEFGERMIYPLVALFFGTGNETPHISSAILERVFLDPNMRLFEFSEASLLASVPTMMAFPELSKIYGAWKEEVESRGNVKVKTSTEISSIDRSRKVRSKGGNVALRYRSVNDSGDLSGSVSKVDGGGEEEEEGIFDEIILACDADSSLKILKAGSGPTWKERQILGSVLYKWDVTITHNDLDYMNKHYEMGYPEKFNANRKDPESLEAFKFAKENWNPLYLIKMYKEDPRKIEMSFDLTVYQPQFKSISDGSNWQSLDQRMGKENADLKEAQQELNIEEKPKSKILSKQGDSQNGSASASASASASPSPPPLEQHVFQTIFLDRDISDEWTKEEIKEEKIILERWWKQQSHRAKHYTHVVPWMWTINGKNHTNYAGAWTVLNMHEIGISSGFSAAYSLGAQFPFKDDAECCRLFRLYHALSRLSRMRSEDRKGFFA